MALYNIANGLSIYYHSFGRQSLQNVRSLTAAPTYQHMQLVRDLAGNVEY